MPDLPTFTVTDAQAQRLLAAFGSADNYKNWLKDQLITYVLDNEMKAQRQSIDALYASKRSELLESLTK